MPMARVNVDNDDNDDEVATDQQQLMISADATHFHAKQSRINALAADLLRICSKFTAAAQRDAHNPSIRMHIDLK